MALQPFHEVLKDPRFQALPEDEKLKAADTYWSRFSEEDPASAKYAETQRESAKALLDTRAKLSSADPISKRALEYQDEALSLKMALNDAVKQGRFKSQEEYQQLTAPRFAELEAKRKAVESFTSFVDTANRESDKREPINEILGVSLASKQLAGAETGTYETAKGNLNDMFNPSAGVAESLRNSGGDIDKAIEFANARITQDQNDLAQMQQYIGMNPAAGVVPEGKAASWKQVPAKLNALKEQMDKQGIPPEDRPRLIQDAAKSTAWTEKDTDLIRKLSNGELVINPGVVFGQKEEVLKQIDASDASQESKDLAKIKLDQMRKRMAGPLATSLVYGGDKSFIEGIFGLQSDYEKFANEKLAKGETSREAILDEWAKQQKDRSGIFKAGDAVNEAIKTGSLGINKTLAGTAAGITALAGADSASSFAKDQQDFNTLIEQSNDASKLRGIVGGYGLTKDAADSVVQMAPMFAGGVVAQGTKGIVSGLTAFASVDGWAAAQGYESKLQDAVNMEKSKLKRDLTTEEVVKTLADPTTQIAAFANGIQTAALTRILPGGSERAALGKLGKEVESMTVADFLTAGGRAALKDSTLRAELKKMGKTIFKDWADESLEEGLNQALDKAISIGVLGETLKMGDLLEESFQAAGIGGIVGGIVPQIRTGTHEQTDAEVERRANAVQLQAATQENLPPAQAAGGTVTPSGDAGVATSVARMTREDLQAAIDDKVQQLESIGAREIIGPDGKMMKNPNQRILTYEEKSLLDKLRSMKPEDIAAERGIEIISSPEAAAEPGGDVAATARETLPVTQTETRRGVGESAASTPASLSPQIPTTTTNEEVQRQGQGQGRQEVLTPEASPAEKAGEAVASVVENVKADNVDLRAEANQTGIQLFGITVPKGERRKGKASNAISELKSVSDQTGLPISLTVEPSEDMSKLTLINWYSKQGFELQNDGDTMIYTPQQTNENQNQVQETGGTPPVQSKPANAPAASEAQAGTAQRKGEGQEKVEVPKGTTAQIARAKELVGKEELTRRAALWEEANAPDNPRMDVGLEAAAYRTAAGMWEEVEPKLQARIDARKTKSQTFSEVAALVEQDPSPENVARLTLAAMGLAPVETAPAATTQPKLVQGELFQNPEPEGDPAAKKYIQSFKGTPPKGATRAILDYAGDPLLARGELGDLPAHTVRDINLADNLIQRMTKGVKKNGIWGSVTKVGRIGFNEFLGKLWKLNNRGVKPGWVNFRDRRNIRKLAKILSFEVAHALTKDGSGRDWYRAKIDKMYSLLSKEFPELATDGKERFLFSVILAATSNGQDVLSNMEDALRIYRDMRGSDNVPGKVSIKRSSRNGPVNQSIRNARILIDELGWEGAKKFMLEPITVSEMKKQHGIELKGELADHKVIGAMVMGPKIGSFWGNLNGHYDSITMDLWFTRSMNRLSGDNSTLNHTKFAKALEELSKLDGVPANVKQEIKDYTRAARDGEGEAWTKIVSDIREEVDVLYDWLKQTLSDYVATGFAQEARTPLNLKVKAIVESLDGGSETPDNGTHRAWMRNVVETAQADLKKNGINITNADLQAILWFHEKDLYTRFGATSSRGGRMDYAQAADTAIKKSRMAGETTGPEIVSQDQPLELMREVPSVKPESRAERDARKYREAMGVLEQNEGSAKGTYTPAAINAGKAVINLATGKADQSTGLHEAVHGVREFMDQTGALSPEEVQQIEEWSGAKDGKWDRAAEEKFARGWERFVIDGVKTGIEAVDKAFAKIAKFMADIYKNIQGSSVDIEIPPHIRDIFNKMVARGYELERKGEAPKAVPIAIKATLKPAPTKKAAPALPPKLPKPQSRSTSIKNAATDRYLVENGMAPMLAPARQSNEDTWDAAMARVEADDKAGSNLVDSINNSERSVNDEVEEGVLLHEMAVRKARVARYRNAVIEARKSGDENAVREAQRNLQSAQGELIEAVVAAKLAGTAWGRIGQFRQRAIGEDFTLEAMEARFAAEINDGAPLTADQSRLIAEMQAKIIEAEARVAEAEAAIAIKQREADAVLKKLEEKKPRAAVDRRGLTERVKEKVPGYRDTLAKLGFGRRVLEQREEGVLRQDSEPQLPLEALEAFGGIAASYILEGKSESDVLEQLANEFGNAVIDSNGEDILTVAREQLAKTAAGSRAKTPTELFNLLDPENPELSNRLVFNMVRGFINQGVPKEKVLKKVLNLLNNKFPDLTYDELSDLFTGYGKVKFPSQEEDLKAVRELRNIERISRQIREIEAGNIPKKTGQQRDAATARIRELQKERAEAFRRMGIKHTTSEAQLKGALDSIKTRLKNEIEDLDRAIATKTKIDRKKTQVEYDEEIKALQAKREARRKEYDDLFGVSRKALSDEQRLKTVVESLNKRIAEERELAAKGLVDRIKSSTKPVTNAEVDRLRSTLNNLVKARAAAKAALNPEISEEGRALSRAKGLAEKQIAYYERLKAGLPVDKKAPLNITPGEELARLWTLRDELKAAVEEMRKEQRRALAKSPEAKARAAAIKALERSVADLEARVKRGDLSKKSRTGILGPLNEAETELKKRQEAAQAALKALRDAKLPTEEERRENALVRASETRRKKIEARIAAGDYLKVAPVDRAMSTRLAAARLAESKAKEEWNRGFFEKQLAERSLGKKIYDSTAELLNFSRTMKTIADVSAVLRQGLVTMLSHPFLSLSAIPDMFRAGFSETQHQRIKNEIESHPLFAISQQAKLFISDSGPEYTLSKIEEAFRGRWAKKVPGLRNVVGFSERTYNAYLNKVRMAQFANMVNGFTGGKPTLAEAKTIAAYVNRATGRGDLKQFESAAAGLAAAFFSPKFVVSRFQILWGVMPTSFNAVTGFQFVPKDVRRAKKAVAAEYVRLLTGIASVYGLAVLAKAGFGDDDDEWELDPRSSSFGRIKIGNTKIDPMGGLLQAATFGARMLPTKTNGVWAPHTKTGRGEVVSLWRPGFGKQSYVGVIGQFLRTKLSPVPASVINVMQGEDVIGQPVTIASESVGSIMPLVYGDIYSTMKENGIAGAPLAVATMFGLGVQTKNNELELEQFLTTLAGVPAAEYERKKASDTRNDKMQLNLKVDLDLNLDRNTR